MSDNIFYRDAFIICNVIDDGEGQAKLDIPFLTYHMTITENQNQHYCYLTNDLIGKEVLVYIHYKIADEAEVFGFTGYLGNDWKEVRKKLAATKHWSMKKSEALAMVNELGVSAPYTGAGKAEVIHPYMAEDEALKK